MAVVEPISPPAEASGSEPPGTALAGAPPRRWKWTGDDLIRMGEAGLLPPEGRFELLDGEIYEIMPPSPLHAYLVDLLSNLLRQVAGGLGGQARQQKPIRLTNESDSQADIALVRGQGREYRERFPGPEDILLIVEVADSSVEHDRVLKLPAYSDAGIPEFWLVNLPEGRVEVYREPDGREYRTCRIYRTGETIEPLAATGSEIPVSVLLGEPEPSAPASPAE